jgi:hypothetical protein
MRAARQKNSEYPSQVQRLLHLLTLSQLAIAWPILEILGRQPEFFSARLVSGDTIWKLTALLVLLLPIALFAGLYLLNLLNRKVSHACYILVVFCLLLLLCLSLSNVGWIPNIRLAGCIFTAVFITFLYSHYQLGRFFVTLLSPAIIAVPLIFLFTEGIRVQLWETDTNSRQQISVQENNAPIIFIIFDEFPGRELQDETGHLRRDLFPGFGALADTSYWYPNATTVATSTVLALPAILTGIFPKEFKMPHYGAYPDNLFTWLGTDYRHNVSEAVSVLCPQELCASNKPDTQDYLLLIEDLTALYLHRIASDILESWLPQVSSSWQGFWSTRKTDYHMFEHRLEQLRRFSDRIQEKSLPGLDFIHINLPHIPYEYLPTGKRYQNAWLIPGLDTGLDIWVGNEWNIVQNYQRFLFQLKAVDNWLFELLQQLKQKNLFDRSLIVVTADHGAAFSIGRGRRDPPPLENLDENILPVPLFIKTPYQSSGLVSLQNAQTIDIIPTIAEIIDRPLHWPVDGVSLLEEPRNPEKKAFYAYKKMHLHASDVNQVARLNMPAWKQAYFSSGLTEDQLFSVGDHYDLFGKSIAELNISTDRGFVVRQEQPDIFKNVDTSSEFLPAHISGWVNRGGDLAIALNGKVAALTSAYTISNDTDLRFSAIVSEEFFKDGYNDLEVFLVDSEDPTRLLRATTEQMSKSGSWRLDDNVLLRDDQTLAMAQDELSGAIFYISNEADALDIFGWAIDTNGPQQVEKILVFQGTRLIHQGTTDVMVAETNQFDVLIPLGFHFVISSAAIAESVPSRISVFAVTRDGRANRLHPTP